MISPLLGHQQRRSGERATKHQNADCDNNLRISDNPDNQILPGNMRHQPFRERIKAIARISPASKRTAAGVILPCPKTRIFATRSATLTQKDLPQSGSGRDFELDIS
jgi:hypothetical protein